MTHRMCGVVVVALVVVAGLAGCSKHSGEGAREPAVIRLVDVFTPKAIEGAAPAEAAAEPRAIWRFDTPAAPSADKRLAATRGWDSANVQGLAVRDGRLVGRTTTAFPILHVARTRDLDNAEQVHAVEIRMQASAGANLFLTTQGAAPVDLARAELRARRMPWPLTTPIVADGEFHTYVVPSVVPLNMLRVRQLLIKPTDAANATFAIESVRLITEREHLAGISSGVAWQGLKDIFHEAIVSRSPETLRFDVTVPPEGRLELALGTMEDLPPTFRVSVAENGQEPRVLLEHTVSTPNRWEPQAVDLRSFANRSVSLALSISADRPGTIGLWGTPTLRTGARAEAAAPRGVILIHADTLRADHLGLYGYGRETAPFLSRLGKEGAVFRHAFAQAGWTKVSTPSFLTSLYPTTHGVWSIPDRLPASATTIAEVYRAAGYDTVSYSSVPFTGSGSNLHQGFEELHEATSARVDERYTTKTAREFVDRAGEWIARHERAPFFIYLHIFDPHSPFEPRRPYDGLWADAAKREEHLRQRDALRKAIGNPVMAERAMATRDEMIKAGVDPAAYLAHDQDWYDGSIRGLDAELSRLFERLRAMGLDRDVAVVFLADHGEEFQEHGRMWHGQSVYGEMMHVPLVVRWPAGVQPGVVDEPVELIDVMPTLLELSGLATPAGVQGQSLVPLLQRSGTGERRGWKRRPVIMEKQPQGEAEFPGASESYAIIDGDWKLVVNKVRAPGQPEYELYEFPRDPLDRTNVAADHPDVVQRLAKAVDGWHTMAAAARLKADADASKGLSPEELQRLRSLGYVK